MLLLQTFFSGVSWGSVKDFRFLRVMGCGTSTELGQGGGGSGANGVEDAVGNVCLISSIFYFPAKFHDFLTISCSTELDFDSLIFIV